MSSPPPGNKLWPVMASLANSAAARDAYATVHRWPRNASRWTRVSTTSPKVPKAVRTVRSRSPATDRAPVPALPPQSSDRCFAGARSPVMWSAERVNVFAPSSFLPWCRSQCDRWSSRFRPKMSYVALRISGSASSATVGTRCRCVHSGPSGQRPRAKSKQKSFAPDSEPSVAPPSVSGRHRVDDRFRCAGRASAMRSGPPRSSDP
mmetsp:Transcript_7085/g.22371  ORF Transcript_7085/g.22371 Transcript_7085/m.22371 type:complete len:206 (+) Transcript_7085:126-743(+)